MNREKLPELILRLGAAFAFLYPPLNALVNPYSWLGYFPNFLTGSIPDMVLLHGFGIIEVIIALWIVFGKKIFWPSAVASAMLLGIILFNFHNFEVLFRDVSILAMTLSLAVMHFPRKEEGKQ